MLQLVSLEEAPEAAQAIGFPVVLKASTWDLTHKMDSKEAKHWGLVNHIVSRGEGLKRARNFADQLASGPPLLYPAIKQVIRITESVTEYEAFAVHNACSMVETINR